MGARCYNVYNEIASIPHHCYCLTSAYIGLSSNPREGVGLYRSYA